MVKNIATLKSYSSDIPRNQSLMNTITHLYSTRDIRTLTTVTMTALMIKPIKMMTQTMIKRLTREMHTNEKMTVQMVYL